MHFMKLYNGPFSVIKNRTKDIELRLYDEKRKNIKVGEYITFTNIDTEEQITVKCIALHKANSFKELFEKLNANERMGFRDDESPAEMAEQMRK